MILYRFSPHTRTLIFDMDMTLYTNEEYLRSQIDGPIRRFAEIRGAGFEAVKRELAAFQEAWKTAHGAPAGLGSVFQAFGIPIEEIIRWREELCRPEAYLSADPQLRQSLSSLASRYALALLTNNPVLVAQKTLRVLGVEDLFPVLVGLDTCGVSKPHEEPLRRTAALSGSPFERCASIGDRYAIDIALPLELGMGGVLVDGVEDVYTLPAVLDRVHLPNVSG
ncbi:MAG: HAD family hydrolase [Treponema sp.]|jgi:phosphoglycolate phosphatase/putative hydrolase of the HAD superfamily|nr:HAD family hydrolase [Treponema sp.]